MSGFVKLYGSILDSSIWGEPPNVRLLWIAMLAMADADGEVMASIPGLARRANLDLADTASALRVLTEPDQYDRSGVDEGRRVRSIPGGWLLVNYQAYRELRTDKQIASAERAARYRARQKGDDDERVTPARDASRASREVSASASAFVVQGPEEQQKPVGRDVTDETGVGVNPRVFAQQFGSYAPDVLQLVLSSRYRASAIALLDSYLKGLDHPVTTPAELGCAVREYLVDAPNAGRVNPAYFAGFVRRVRGRNARAREEVAIAAHTKQKAEEEADANARAAKRRLAVETFERTHPARYTALAERAESEIDPKHQRGRGILVRGRLMELIAEEIDRTMGDDRASA